MGRREMEEESFRMQSMLFESFVETNILIKAASFLTQDQFKFVIEERAAADLCGYPLCGGKRSKIKGKYKISLKESKLLSMDQLKNYCSRECLASCKYLISQMSQEPHYVRSAMPKIQLLRFKSQERQGTDLEIRMEELTIKERTFDTKESQLGSHTIIDAQDGSTHIAQKENEVQVTWKPNQVSRKVNQDKKDVDHFSSTAQSEEHMDHSSLSDSSSESEVGEEGGWFVPSRKKITMELTDFAKIWLYLDRLITNDSKLVINGRSFSLNKLDPECTARLNIFSKNILLALKSIQKDFGISLMLNDHLLDLLKSFNYKDFSCVLSAKENWILTAVFLKALSIQSSDLNRAFEGKWEKIIQKTSISIDQFNTLYKAFS